MARSGSSRSLTETLAGTRAAALASAIGACSHSSPSTVAGHRKSPLPSLPRRPWSLDRRWQHVDDRIERTHWRCRWWQRTLAACPSLNSSVPMPFSSKDRDVLLSVKGVGPTVITRLESMGFNSLHQLADADPTEILARGASVTGSTCWRNSPRAKAAIDGAIAAAVSHISPSDE